MSYELAFACPGPDCGEPVEGPLTAESTAIACPACQHETALPEARETLESVPLSRCCVCGSNDLYSQRDFNRPLGLTIAAIGLLLGPFTMWISTVAAIALDAILYLIVSTVSVCYACNAQYRGVAKAARPEVFDIAIHDVYKFNRRHPPRREVAVAGPLQKRLRAEAPPQPK